MRCDVVRRVAHGVEGEALGVALGRDGVDVGGADQLAVCPEKRIEVRNHEVARLVRGELGDAVEDGTARAAHLFVEGHVGVRVGGGEDVGGGEADHAPFILDAGHLAVAPVQRHEASVQVLHVEAQLGRGVEHRLERGGVRPERPEEGVSQDLLSSYRHAAILLSVVRVADYTLFFIRMYNARFSFLRECLQRQLQTPSLISLLGGSEFWRLGENFVLSASNSRTKVRQIAERKCVKQPNESASNSRTALDPLGMI